MSVIAACVAKYGTLTMAFTPKPSLWFDGIPQTDGSGAATTLPWVNLVDEGLTVDQSSAAGFDLEYHPIEVQTVRFEVYAVLLSDVDSILTGIKYGTGAVTAQEGFDFGTLTITGETSMECRRLSEHRGRAPQLQEAGRYVYQGDVRYVVEAQVT